MEMAWLTTKVKTLFYYEADKRVRSSHVKWLDLDGDGMAHYKGKDTALFCGTCDDPGA